MVANIRVSEGKVFPAKYFLKTNWELFGNRGRTQCCDAIKAFPGDNIMDDNLIGLAAVVMTLGIPMALMYTYYRVRRLRTDERLAALARGVNVPMEPELSELGRSRRAGILLTTGALGYIATFGLIARSE